MSSHVQSVMIRKRPGYTPAKARKKLLQLGFRDYKLDVATNWYRFRQVNPDKRKFRYRSKEINKNLMFIIGFPKKK